MRNFHSVPCKHFVCRRPTMNDDALCSDLCRREFAARAARLARGEAAGAPQAPAATFALPLLDGASRDRSSAVPASSAGGER